MAENVYLGPAEINFPDPPIGIREILWWGMGTDDDPEDLTGRGAVVVLSPGTPSQTRITPTIDALEGGIWCPVPDLSGSIAYVLLVQDTPGGRYKARARGRITPGVRVTPWQTP